jgi:transposase
VGSRANCRIVERQYRGDTLTARPAHKEVALEPNRFRHYIGIDWATEAHRICLLDHNGQLCGKTSIPHSGAGQAQLLEWLAHHGVAAALAAVGIETPRGAVVETLVERGYAVFVINPKQLERFRGRYSTAGAKDDDRDAWVAASALRTDPTAFHRVFIDAAEVIRLRELYRTHQQLQVDAQGCACRLSEQLRRYYPQMLAVSPAGDQPLLWDLLELAPQPEVAGQLRSEQITAVLHQRRIRRFTAEPLLAQLRATPLQVAAGVAAAASARALVLITQLRLVHELRQQTRKRMLLLVRQMCAHRLDPQRPSDAEIIDSLPGAGLLTVAAMLSEASQAIAERNGEALRALAGVAPVTRRSGKFVGVGMRRACNHRLRDAFHHFTMGSLRGDAISRHHYESLRQQGHDHARALRGVGDRWVPVLIAMLRAGQLYDASRRKAGRAVAAAEPTS